MKVMMMMMISTVYTAKWSELQRRYEYAFMLF